MKNVKKLIESRHPLYTSYMSDWEKFRDTFKGGAEYKRKYLKPLSARESAQDFNTRLEMTPTPSFAKSAVKEIRNSIYQRLRDIQRQGGTASYMKAVAGQSGGVDNKGASMTKYLGKGIMDDLLVMGQVGVYVDNFITNETPTLANTAGKHPYIYHYEREDILDWDAPDPESPSAFNSLLLRDKVMERDEFTGFPKGETKRFRHYQMQDGRVTVQFYDKDGKPVDQFGNPGGLQVLDLPAIPFVLFDIGESLLTDVAEYQISLLNLSSTDINYAWRSNFPFYVEQASGTGLGGGCNTSSEKIAASYGVNGEELEPENSVRVGAMHGRSYPSGANAPTFIAPPTEPLAVSLKLQEKLEADIRKMVHLAVQTLATRASAESKSLDNQGLDSGLSFIGETMEAGEREIAQHWANYEKANVTTIVNYPTNYSLKTDSQRVEEAEQLGEFISKVPSRTAKKEISKCMANSLLAGKISPEKLDAIYAEIDAAAYTTSDTDSIIRAKEAGLVGDQVASMALGFPDGEYLVAREDHTERVKRIAETQGITNDARGVDDLDSDPANSGSREKEPQAKNDLQEDGKKNFRGEGKA